MARQSLRRRTVVGALAAAGAFLAAASIPSWAEDTYNPTCFRPMEGVTKTLSIEARPGPYRLALVNGFVGNSWRIQMIQGLKAWASHAENAKDIKELKIVSTGTDVAAQIGAVDNLIAAGYDGIVINAVNPTSFGPVINRAIRAGTVLVSFDNAIDSDKIIIVNEPQIEFEKVKAQFVYDNLQTKTGKVLEVRGLPGNSVDRDRSAAMHMVFDNQPGIEVVSVVGNWDDGTTQKVVSDAIATYGHFIGIVAQHASTGLLNALNDAKHPKIPLGTSGENGSLKMIHDGGWTAIARVQTPYMSVVAMQAAIAQLQGKVLPQQIALPIPTLYSKDLKEGVNYFKDLPDNFQDGADIPECKVVIPPDQLLKQTPDNT
jgi:ribose transport system substrate-binding protein